MDIVLRRLHKFVSHPAFRHAPLTTLWHALCWVVWVSIGRAPVFRLSRRGGRLRVPADYRYTSISCFVLRDWAEIDLHYLDRLLAPGDVFFDIGANIGIYSLQAAPLVGTGGCVVAAEPGQISADRLAANLALNPEFTQVRLLRKAVTDHEGQATFYHVFVGDDPQTFSLLTDGSHHGSEQVALTTIDQTMADLGLSRLDVLKIDVEGAEAQVLAGARQTLERLRPIVLFEVNAELVRHRGDDATRAFRALQAHGYDFFVRRPDGRLVPRTTQPEGWGNLVAIHPDGRQPPG